MYLDVSNLTQLEDMFGVVEFMVKVDYLKQMSSINMEFIINQI